MSDLYRERLIDPCILMYGKVLRLYGYAPDQAALLCEEERKALEERGMFAVPRISLFCTNKCTYRCEECISFVTHYAESHVEEDLSKLTASLDLFLSGVDRCYILNFNTGEILLYPYLKELLEYYLDNPKIQMIDLLTNGTVMPDERLLDILRHPKVHIEITDYGNIAQMGKLVGFLERYGIKCIVQHVARWIPVNNLSPRGKSMEGLRADYARCSMGKNCKAIFKGKIYHCLMGATMIDLNPARYHEGDCLELLPTDTDALVQEKLRRFFLKDHAYICDYCDMGSLNPQTIPPAVQKGGNLKYSNHTIIERAQYRELQEAKDWLEGQYNNYKNEYESLHEYVEQLQEGKDWLEAQYNTYKRLYEGSIKKR